MIGKARRRVLMMGKASRHEGAQGAQFSRLDPLKIEPTISNNESPIPEEEILERGYYARDWQDDSNEGRVGDGRPRQN